MKNNLQFTIYNFQFHFSISKLLNWQIKSKIENRKSKIQRGFTLLEILVVVSIFAVLGILITQSIILSIAGSKKSESVVRVRDNLNYSISVIERQLRNANGITECPNSDPNILSYTDQNGNSASFSCILPEGGQGSIASGSGALTGTDVNVTGCSFACTLGVGVNPPTVSVSIEAKDASASGVQSADVTITSQIDLRNY